MINPSNIIKLYYSGFFSVELKKKVNKSYISFLFSSSALHLAARNEDILSVRISLANVKREHEQQ